MKKTICELFAGVGGFRLGFERQNSKWKTVWFSQWEPGKKNQWAHDCYVSHFGDIDEFTGIDVSEVNKKKIPDHNLLVGGFPCQDYSVARPLSGSSGIEGKKGVLWWQIYDILKAKKAPFGLFENVDRLLKSPANQRGRDFAIMLSCLANLNYSVEWRVVNAAEYGGAQRRRRVFIFAYKNDTNYAKKHSFTNENLLSTEFVDGIISKTGLMAKAFPIINHDDIKHVQLPHIKKSPRVVGNIDVQKVSDEFKFEFENAGFLNGDIIYTTKVTPLEEKAIPLSKIVQHGVNEKYYLGDNLEKWSYLKGAKKIERTSKDGHKYIFSEGAISFPDPLNLPARTMLTSESSLNRSTHVIEDPKTNELRLLTPIEAERIQGFDDDWTNTGMPEKFRYFCMGNALVVPMITRMASVLDKIFKNEK